jgi:hypothetical protein
VSFFEAMQLAQGCLNVGLLIAIIVIRRIGKDEIRRGQSALRAEKERLAAHIVAVEKKTDDALKRLHDAELGIAGIRPQLESLSVRVGELQDAVGRCATRDDVVRVLGKLEGVLSTLGELRAERRATGDAKPS